MIEKLHWDDLAISPAIESDIDSRKKEITINYSTGEIPLIVSPMDTVVDTKNVKDFLSEDYIVCLPRTANDTKEFWNSCFISFGVDDLKEAMDSGNVPPKVLIDVANGHMKKVMILAKEFVSKFPDKKLMVGNIAHPETYRIYADIGVWGVRCSVGTGSACTTSANAAVHYAPASLIDECYNVSCEFNNPPKIIADGGFKNFATIIKALGMGADYVMLGGVLNKALESCSEFYTKQELITASSSQKTSEMIKIAKEEAENIFKGGGEVFKYFRGMSTKEVQRDWKRKVLTTSEGITKYNKVEYTLHGWTENFKDYLRSTMSYCGKRDITRFIGQVEFTRISINTFNAFNK